MSASVSVTSYTARYKLTGGNSSRNYRSYIPSRRIQWPWSRNDDDTETLSLDEELTKCTSELQAEAAKSYVCRLFILDNFDIQNDLDSTQVQLVDALQKLSDYIENVVMDMAVAEKLAEVLMGTDHRSCMITTSIMDPKRRDSAEDDRTERLTVLWTCLQSGADEPSQIDQQNVAWEFGFKLTQESDADGSIALTFDLVGEPSEVRIY